MWKKRTRNAPAWHKTGNKKSITKIFESSFWTRGIIFFLCFFVFFSFRCLSYIFYSLFVPLRTRLMKKWLILTLAKIFFCKNVKWFFSLFCVSCEKLVSLWHFLAQKRLYWKNFSFSRSLLEKKFWASKVGTFFYVLHFFCGP